MTLGRALLTALGVSMPVIAGVILVMAALGDKLARWGGYAGALPLLGMLVLFLVGSLLVHAFVPRRRVAR